MTGRILGRLTVERPLRVQITPNGTNKLMWQCRCVCGRVVRVGAGDLRRKDGKAVRSCVLCGRTKHGHTKTGWQSPTYKSWRSMLTRCDRDLGYITAGIKVCERWKSFENFLADMGSRPRKRTIDRKNNLKGYTPDNCRWATSIQQSRNTSSNVMFTLNGKTQVLADWLRELGLSSGTYYDRIYRGIEPIVALTSK